MRAIWIGLLLCCLGATAEAQTVRLKDLVRVSSQRENALVGYGIVTGLSGSGDSGRNKATRVTLANLLNRFELNLSSDDMTSRNVAIVMVTSSMPAYARPGDQVDVSVTSIGDARSLEGGTLLMAPLKGADGRVYVLAQGPLTVGGYRFDADGNQAQKNHPTAGLVSGGGVVEAAIEDSDDGGPTALSLVLSNADYVTAGRIADSINASFGAELANVRDAGSIEVGLPAEYRRRVAGFVRKLEALSVEPDRRARVVVNERTGTIVTGGEVLIGPVAVVVGETKVTVSTEAVSAFARPRGFAPGRPRPEILTNSQLKVTEPAAALFIQPTGTRVSELAQALAKAKTPARDIISILQAIKAAGALYAELIVQ